jgi:hypothetical protein
MIEGDARLWRAVLTEKQRAVLTKIKGETNFV